MTACSLTLLFPALVRPDGGWPQMPALQTLLSKGTREEAPDTLSASLFALFGLQAAEGDGGAVAALSALGDGLAVTGGWWLRCDPVHLVADRDQLYLSAAETLQLSRTEAEALVAELNRIYAEDGWQFIAATPKRWYLRLPRPLSLRTTPTHEAVGRRVGEVLPQGEDAMIWQRVMTEVQMVLHTSLVNAQRAERGELLVNGLWTWGGGSLPQGKTAARWGRVVADEPLARGLAQWYGLPLESVAATDLATLDGEVLWVGEGAGTGACGVEQAYFAPLLAMLQSGQLSQLVLELPGQGRWRIERSALRRWWRRRLPLATLLK